MNTKQQKGLKIVEKLYGQDGINKINELQHFANDFSELLLDEFATLCESEVIDSQLRNAITVAAAIALNDTDDFKSVLSAALANGLSLDQVKEIIMHLTLYCGFPRTVHAMLVLKELTTEK